MELYWLYLLALVLVLKEGVRLLNAFQVTVKIIIMTNKVIYWVLGVLVSLLFVIPMLFNFVHPWAAALFLVAGIIFIIKQLTKTTK